MGGLQSIAFHLGCTGVDGVDVTILQNTNTLTIFNARGAVLLNWALVGLLEEVEVIALI